MSEISSKIESLADQEKTPAGEYQRWLSELQAFEKETDKWRRNARKIVKQYRAEHTEVSGYDPTMERRFNLFAANVGILQTSLMNQTPQPTVNREFKDVADDVARVASTILERALSSHNNRNFKTANILKQAVQDMLVPGVGLTWHTYHAEIETKTMEPTDAQKEVNPQAEALEYDEVISEEIRDEYVYWEDLCWSPARTYDEVRWIGRKTYLTRDQGMKRFGKAFANVPLDFNPKKSDNSVETKNVIFQQAVVYEIWDKESEQVIWLCKGYDKILDQKDDFLELDDFFPCPQPLVANMSNGQYLPIPDFNYAKDQYRELNEINTRISLLVRACRVAGVYDKSAGQVQALVNNAAENTLVPVDQWAAFAEKGGIKGAIDWIPLDQIVATIDQLLKNREDVKSQIYEITGMSDIIRGASKASETLGAQKLKAQYASMRIQERQKNVVQFCSAIFDIQLQLMRKHMDPAEIAKLAQVQFMNEDQELVQQAMQLIKMPEFVLRCIVESDTLSDIDFQAEKQDRMEYMQTITTYLKEVLPTIQGDPVMGPFLMQLLQFSLAGFKIGKKFEGELDRTFSQITQQLQNPQPPQPSPEEQKAQAQIELMKQEGQQNAEAHQQDLQFKKQEGQMKLGARQQELQLKLQGKVQEAHVNQQVQNQKMQTQQAQFWQNLEQQRVASAQAGANYGGQSGETPVRLVPRAQKIG
jgi:hypothetical protein